MASALNAAHRAGLVHRDVKPSNILLAEDDFAYLIDFGIARGAEETGLTGTGNVIGTWPYMAPERFSTGRSDKSSDIYALACVLYECLTASRPFPGESVEQQIAGHLTTPPPRPSTTRPGVTPQLDAVIAVGMAKDPDQRYDTTTELARAARTALTEPVTQRVTAPDPRTRAARSVSAPTERVTPGEVRPPTGARTPTDVHDQWAPAQQHPPENFYPPAAATRARPAEYGPGPSTPTYVRPGDSGPLVVSPPEATPDRLPVPAPKVPWWQRKSIVFPIAVILMIGAVATILTVVMGGESSTSQSAAGPLDGTFAVDFGGATRPNGQPYDNAPGGRETWAIESSCSTGACVATASRIDGSQSQGPQWYSTRSARPGRRSPRHRGRVKAPPPSIGSRCLWIRAKTVR